MGPIEVITSVQRRRRWSPEEKRAILEEAELPGNSLSAVARKYGVNPNQLFHWRKLMREGAIVAFGADEHIVPDQRVALLESIVRRGWHLRLFGPGYDWDLVIHRSPELAGQVPVRLVWGEEYNRALCGARVALCFLSKLNGDTYTRRCFEIPAARTFILSEYSDDLASLF